MKENYESNCTSLQYAKGSAGLRCVATAAARITLCEKRGGKNTILPQAWTNTKTPSQRDAIADGHWDGGHLWYYEAMLHNLLISVI